VTVNIAAIRSLLNQMLFQTTLVTATNTTPSLNHTSNTTVISTEQSIQYYRQKAIEELEAACPILWAYKANSHCLSTYVSVITIIDNVIFCYFYDINIHVYTYIGMVRLLCIIE
jgi:hypothetical protein